MGKECDMDCYEGIYHCGGGVDRHLCQSYEVPLYRHLSVVGADKIGQSSYVGSVGSGIQSKVV